MVLIRNNTEGLATSQHETATFELAVMQLVQYYTNIWLYIYKQKITAPMYSTAQLSFSDKHVVSLFTVKMMGIR